MAVPEEIRQVERPTNTVVVDRGGNGPKRFAVIERVGCRRVNGKNRPVDGKTVGHIIDGRFVPRKAAKKAAPSKEPVTASAPEPSGYASPQVTYGAVQLCEISVGSHSAQGISVDIPGTTLHVLQVRCRRGMLFCGLFDQAVLERLDFPAAVFSAPEFSDMMERTPAFLTRAAQGIGARMDMTGKELVAVFEQA